MAAERWYEPYEKPGRSGMVAQMSVTGGLPAGWWTTHKVKEQARRDAGLETEWDCD